MVGEQKVNMIWNPLTKPINFICQSVKSVKNSILSNFFLILMTSHDVINDVFLQTYRFFPDMLIYDFNNYYLRRQFYTKKMKLENVHILRHSSRKKRIYMFWKLDMMRSNEKKIIKIRPQTKNRQGGENPPPWVNHRIWKTLIYHGLKNIILTYSSSIVFHIRLGTVH